MMDVYDLWEQRENEMERRLAKCPVCCCCGHRIQEDVLFDIGGQLYHKECAEQEFLKLTEEYET